MAALNPLTSSQIADLTPTAPATPVSANKPKDMSAEELRAVIRAEATRIWKELITAFQAAQ